MNQKFTSKHSNRTKDGSECRAIFGGGMSAHNQPTLELIDEDVLGGDVAQVRAQRYAVSKIEKSLFDMLHNLDKPIQMPTLSRLAGVSISHFYYLFKCATGHAPNHFLIRARMRRGCELLRGTDMRVKEVAGMLGYVDPLYFSRIFKSVHGVAPSQYRVMPAAPDNATPCTKVSQVIPREITRERTASNQSHHPSLDNPPDSNATHHLRKVRNDRPLEISSKPRDRVRPRQNQSRHRTPCWYVSKY